MLSCVLLATSHGSPCLWAVGPTHSLLHHLAAPTLELPLTQAAGPPHISSHYSLLTHRLPLTWHCADVAPVDPVAQHHDARATLQVTTASGRAAPGLQAQRVVLGPQLVRLQHSMHSRGSGLHS